MREQRNEAGKKISAKKAKEQQNDIYKKWQQKTHLSLQRTGEREDSKLVAQARGQSESRGMYKQFQKSHSDLNKGEDVRSTKHLIESKTKKLQKMQQSKHDEKHDGKKSLSGQKRSYSEKANNKITAGQTPTRSKMIVKGAYSGPNHGNKTKGKRR